MKKTRIIHTAFDLFTENGYAATSIQEIVSICKMSKATFYHYFSSKKELFYEVLHFRDELFESQLKALEHELSHQIRFQKQTELYMESLHKNRTLFLLVPFVIEQEEFIELEQGIKKFKVKTYKRLEDMLSSVYQLEDRSNKWDLVLLYDSLIKEYIEIGSYHDEYLDIPIAVQSVRKYLDLLIHYEIEPMLSTRLMKEFMKSIDSDSKTDGRYDQMALILMSLEEKIDRMHVTDVERAAYKGNLNLLREEIMQSQPRIAVIKSVLAFFELKSELNGTVEQIKSLLAIESNVSV